MVRCLQKQVSKGEALQDLRVPGCPGMVVWCGWDVNRVVSMEWHACMHA